MKVVIDKRVGVKNVDMVYDIELSSEAVDLLLKLDGLVHTMLLFQREDGSNLMVGGGKISFVVTFTSETQNLTLANLAPDEGCLLEICAGGQFGEYPSEIVVGFDAAASAVLHFFANDEKLLEWL